MNKDYELREIPMEVRFEDRAEGDAGDAIGKIVGSAAVFGKNSLDLGGFTESIKRGAFSETIKEDDVRALVNHDPSQLLGRSDSGTLRLKETREGLQMEIDVPDTQAGRDARTSIKRGDMDGASFGFRTIDDEWNTNNEVPHRTLKKVRLFDVGPVTFPAYPDTLVATRSLDAWNDSKNKEAGGGSQIPPKRDRLKAFRLRQQHAEATLQ